MNIYEYTLIDGITTGTIIADSYELVGREYVFFLTKFGIEREVYSIPANWVMESDIKCLTCADVLGVYNG